MAFSTDAESNKAVVCAGVPDNGSKEGLAIEWLNEVMKPLKGKGGGGNNRIAQGQVSSSKTKITALNFLF